MVLLYHTHMSTKIIYFIRHGETESNANNIRQGSTGFLSEKGRAQALETAKKFPHKKGRAEVIISSPFERAKETAEILGKELSLPVEYCDLLVERRNPSEIIGRSGDDEEVRKIVDRIDKSFHDNDLRYSDEENFTDLRNRSRELLKYIKSRKEEKIIMVTHGIFLKMVISTMLHNNHLNASEYNRLSFFNPMENAELTVCRYTTHWYWLGQDFWELLVWNGQTEIIIKPE